MKTLGVSASFLIGHVHFWGGWMRDRVFGPERVNHLCRCRSAEDAGIGFTLHSDFMVTDPDPLHMIQMAVTRTTWKENAGDPRLQPLLPPESGTVSHRMDGRRRQTVRSATRIGTPMKGM